MDPLFELNGKLILVSGGSRGIGKALVSGFAKRGARVVFTGRDEVSLESAKKDLAKSFLADSSETSSLPVKTTLAPLFAKPDTSALPIPRLPPETRISLPFNSKRGSIKIRVEVENF